MAWGGLNQQPQWWSLPRILRDTPRGASARGAISPALSSPVGLGIVPGTMFIPLSLRASAPRLQRTGRLCALSLVLPNPLSSHTAAVLSSVKLPLESVSQERLQGPPLAAGQQLRVAQFLPLLTLPLKMFTTWFLEGKHFKSLMVNSHLSCFRNVKISF